MMATLIGVAVVALLVIAVALPLLSWRDWHRRTGGTR